MIYPNITTEEWCNRYPDLEVIHGICDNCRSPMPTTVPFLTQDGVGLESKPCKCGKNRFKAISLSTTDDFFEDLLALESGSN